MQYESEEKEKDASDRVTESEDGGDADPFFDPRASVLEVKSKFLCWTHGLQVVQETL